LIRVDRRLRSRGSDQFTIGSAFESSGLLGLLGLGAIGKRAGAPAPLAAIGLIEVTRTLGGTLLLIQRKLSIRVYSVEGKWKKRAMETRWAITSLLFTLRSTLAPMVGMERGFCDMRVRRISNVPLTLLFREGLQ